MPGLFRYPGATESTESAVEGAESNKSRGRGGGGAVQALSYDQPQRAPVNIVSLILGITIISTGEESHFRKAEFRCSGYGGGRGDDPDEP